MDKTIEFLYHTLEDARSSIRAMDMKSNIMSAICIGVLVAISKVAPHNSTLIVWTYLAGLFTIVLFMYGVILPRFNPQNNLKNLDNDLKKTLYFPFQEKDYDTYIKDIKSIEDDDIVNILSFERLKLQVILEVKFNYFKIAIYWGVIPFVFFSILTAITIK